MIGGTIGNLVTAAAFAGQRVSADRAIAGARTGAAMARATAAVAAQTADELRRDVILQRMENTDLAEQAEELRDELKAERARTEALVGMLVDARNPDLSPAQRAVVLADALAVVRQARAA